MAAQYSFLLLSPPAKIGSLSRRALPIKRVVPLRLDKRKKTEYIQVQLPEQCGSRVGCSLEEEGQEVSQDVSPVNYFRYINAKRKLIGCVFSTDCAKRENLVERVSGLNRRSRSGRACAESFGA